MAGKEKAAGTESPDATGGGKQPDGERTFTQAELDAVIGDRLQRQRAQYADYDDLKAQAEKWSEHEEAQKSEIQKALEAQQAAEKAGAVAIAQANERLIQAEFIAEASKLAVQHPADAYALADRGAVEVTEDGKVKGVEEAVKALVDNGRLPLTTKPKAPNLDGGAGSGERGGDSKPLTEAEKAMAARLGLTPEQYQAGKQAVPTPEERRAQEQKT